MAKYVLYVLAGEISGEKKEKTISFGINSPVFEFNHRYITNEQQNL